MPIYEFTCPGGHLTEILLSRAEAEELEEGAQRDCPECGDPLRRIFPTSPPSFTFKGPGFHTNDYSKYGPKKV